MKETKGVEHLSGLKNLKKNEILFREGDQSDAMYVIKSGKIAITKSKGHSEITLAELGPGDMLGEMAFFDNRPRSAGAKAVVDTVVIELPFKALNAQFKTFPEWLKAIVRTVNNHLRSANQKIKNLEKTSEDETVYFPPHTVTRLIAILTLVAARYGEPQGESISIPPGTLRKYTIQIFQMPTAKMQKLMEMLQSFGYLKIEDLGEGRQKITLFKLSELIGFVEFYNEWLFKSEDKRVTIDEKELRPIKALIFYGKRESPNEKGEIKVNLTQMQNDAMRDLGHMFTVDDVNTLIEKGITSDKLSTEAGLLLTFNFNDLDIQLPYWEMIHAFSKVQRD